MEVQKFIVVYAIGAYPESEAFRSQRHSQTTPVFFINVFTATCFRSEPKHVAVNRSIKLMLCVTGLIYILVIL